jgi:hypothetical protein
MKLFYFLSGLDDATFCPRITAALNKGWQLHGAPCCAFDAATNSMRCGQAVFKEIEGEAYSPGTRHEDL